MSPPGYELRELLHQGVKSEIFRATRLADGRRVVLKIPHDDGDRHQRLAELRHEFHVAARVKGPGVVEALELIEVGERPFLVFEDIDGVSLARAFPAKLGVASFFPVALQICDSLAEIHARGVIHKDIKPQNIIINASTGQVKLTDLAIASLLADEASTLAPPDRLVGTLAYMAPEQTGRIGRGIDARADLYALGVTFFELLAGRRPFAQTDPMELVHAHIAREPPRLVDVDPSIGPELSDLVAHLLFKDADARYRSALAVRADLRHLLEERGCGAVTPFTPGLRHRGAEFRLPQALYGRERERERLLEAFASAAAGSRALVLVAGTSGAGKSALVHEVHRPMVARRGTFVAGKFDQFNRSVPFASLVQALRLLIDRVVAGSDAEVEVWRRRLLDALGPQVSVLQETLPELELVVGRHPPAAPLAGAEAQNRLHLAVLRFFAAFARADHPLVLFLDDLQWADAATLALLKALVTDPELAHVLVIGAYRDQEVDAHHPLTRALREIDASPTRVVRITLGPLVVGDVRRLIADALTEEPGDVSRLADEVFRRTEGNPLFVREFLKQIVADRLLRYDEADERWRWDVAEIRAAPIPDDVADLLLDRIRRLPPSARRALQVAACVGVAFDLQTLVAVTGADEGELGRDLWDAIQSGLVAALDASYRLLPHSGAGGRPLRLRFVHDRIRQAAYSLVRPEEMPALHLAIGRHLLAALPSRERAEFLDAVDHLNRGRALIIDPAERRSLLALNVEAGRRARAATAYAAAVNFFGAGASLVDDEGWRSDYPLAYALNLGLAEGLYLAGEIDAADAAFERLSARVTSPLDALSVRSLRVTLYVAIGRSSQAIELGVEALRLAGVDIPGDDDGLAAAAAAERARLHERFAARPLAARIDDPPAQDPELRAVIKVMTDLMAPTQLTRQRLFEHLCLKQINLSLEHGHAEASPYGYLVYAFYLTTVAGPVREAYDFGEAALALNERLGAADQASRLNFVFGSILHAYRPLSEVLDFFERARAAGLESGDYIFASYACSHAAIAQLGLGLRVDALLIAVDEALTLMRRTRVASSTAALQITRQLALALRGDTAAPTRLGDAAFDEDAAFAAFDQGRLSFAALWYCIARLALAVLHRDDAAATRWMAEAERRLLNSSWYLTTELTFYAGLHLAATLRRASAEARGPIAARLAEHRRRYAELARSSPANFAAKLALLDAEIAAAAGDRLAALGGYDAAIAEARRQGVAPTEALARELAGRFYLDAGHEVFAASLLADAEVVFRRWGALAKADALVREHGELLRRAVTRSPLRVAAAAELSETSVTATTIDPRLDLSSVIKAAQAFAGEIDLVALLTKVMGVLAENAGAERGALALLEGDALHLAVTYGPEGVVVDERRPLSSDDVPAGVLRHSLRSGRLLLGEDVLESPSFAGDPYLHRRRPLSLLAMPIAYQGRRLGVLYLENRQVWGAFNHYRLETLRLLCAQLAIAIANARMFGELRVARRVAEEANVAKSRFMLNMSHELRTPLNVVIGTSEMLAEEAEDDGDDDAAAELGKITDAGQGLLRIITDVLEITELESGRVELAITSFALRPLLDEVAEAHLGALEASGGALEVELAAADLTVTNDRARLARILDHVLGNAVRFAGDGLITVRAWAADQRLRIAIIDRGIGMTRQQSARIFDAFQQADDSPTRRFGGMGLGLAIVRRLCERMGGSIGVESELGVGSAFTIDLPLVVAA